MPAGNYLVKKLPWSSEVSLLYSYIAISVISALLFAVIMSKFVRISICFPLYCNYKKKIKIFVLSQIHQKRKLDFVERSLPERIGYIFTLCFHA